MRNIRNKKINDKRAEAMITASNKKKDKVQRVMSDDPSVFTLSINPRGFWLSWKGNDIYSEDMPKVCAEMEFVL